MTRTEVIAWDWRGQPDLDQLARTVRDLSDGRVHLHQVKTGSDDYAVAGADRPLSAAEVAAAYRQGFQEDGDD